MRYNSEWLSLIPALPSATKWSPESVPVVETVEQRLGQSTYQQHPSLKNWDSELVLAFFFILEVLQLATSTGKWIFYDHVMM